MPQAFLSYAHVDDDFLSGGITRLRDQLQLAIRVVTGRSFTIFQDKDGIEFGQHWPNRLDEALQSARFLIPILSPSYFTSEHCRDEALKFLEYEEAAGRTDLVLPIYLIEADVLEKEDLRATDPLARRLHERQYDDWRALALDSLDDGEIRTKVTTLARAIAAAAERANKPSPAVRAQVPRPMASPQDDRREATSREAEFAAAMTETEAQRRRLEAANRSLMFRARLLGATAAGALLLLIGGVAAWFYSGNQPDVADRIVALEEQIRQRDASIDELRSETLQQGATIGELTAGASSSADQQATIDDLESRMAGLEQELDSAKAAQARAEAQLIDARAETAKLQDELSRVPFRDCHECPEMVAIPAGTFRMGSEAKANEGPLREVTIPAFVMGKYEVTFAEWDACVAAGGCSHRPEDEWGRGRQPLIDVNWEDAQEYVAWLSEKTGERYRLSSEAEWEYAARAGTTTAFAFGDEIANRDANFDNYERKTTEVGGFRANAWGLHDMHGNVWEWVEDCWNDSYETAPTDGSPWLQGDCPKRIIRGGAWNDARVHVRSAVRGVGKLDSRGDVVGFRVARAL